MLAHFILELCLDIWFHEVNNNFVEPLFPDDIDVDAIRETLTSAVSSNQLKDFSITYNPITGVHDVTVIPIKAVDSVIIKTIVERDD